jgi:hypothetical protein
MCAGLLLGVSERGVSARARSDTEKLLGVESFVLETQTLTDTFIIDRQIYLFIDERLRSFKGIRCGVSSMYNISYLSIYSTRQDLMRV